MSSNDVAISIRGLSKAYTIRNDGLKRPTFREVIVDRLKNPLKRARTETFWALKDVSFEVKKGDVVGIIGRNGAGKSTLLKVLSRIAEPTGGEVDLHGRVGSLLEVGTGFHQELTGRENIYLNGAILGMRRPEIKKQFDAIVAFAEVEKFLDTPVKRYSSGMYVRLAFAVAAHLNPEILIVDEVLAVGDAEFQKKCLGKMKDVSTSGRTVLFVSHNMAAVADLCTSAVMLNGGQVEAIGNLSQVIRCYLDNHTGSKATFSKGPLRSVFVEQQGPELVIEAEYHHTAPISLPAFGFVISDMMGTPICGANPRLWDVPPLEEPKATGRVRVALKQPRLMDGSYRLSAWFGDQYHDFVGHKDCLTFSIAGMAGARQLPVALVGPIYPECVWSIGDIAGVNRITHSLEPARV